MEEIFNDPMMGYEPFVKARVVGKYDELYDMCVELRSMKTSLKQVKKQNKNLANEELREMKRVKSRYLSCFRCCSTQIDSQAYYENQIVVQKSKI